MWRMRGVDKVCNNVGFSGAIEKVRGVLWRIWNYADCRAFECGKQRAHAEKADRRQTAKERSESGAGVSRCGLIIADVSVE